MKRNDSRSSGRSSGGSSRPSGPGGRPDSKGGPRPAGRPTGKPTSKFGPKPGSKFAARPAKPGPDAAPAAPGDKKPILNKQGRPTARPMPKPHPSDRGSKPQGAKKPGGHGSGQGNAQGSAQAKKSGERRPAPTPHVGPTVLPEVAALPAPAEFLNLSKDAGIEFEGDGPTGDLGKLGTYLAFLLEINKTTNLTAIEEPDAAWKRHVFDSLTLIAALADLPEGAKVIDVGSGGGLPGIPLAICMPHLKFTLLEATGKKADFLRQVAKRLDLANVTVVEERAEVLAHDRGDKISSAGQTFREGGHREAYDAVVARAVGRLPTLLELTVPFAKVGTAEGGGHILLIKGEQADAELAEAKEAMHLLKVVHANTLQTPTGRIVAIEKSSATPKNYPRPNGEPKRVPLGVEKK